MESVSKNVPDASVWTEEGTANGPADTAGQSLNGAIVVDAETVRGHLDEVVRSTLEQTLNQLLDEEPDHDREPPRKRLVRREWMFALDTRIGTAEVGTYLSAWRCSLAGAFRRPSIRAARSCRPRRSIPRSPSSMRAIGVRSRPSGR